MQKNCSTYCKSILEIGGGQRARGHDSWAPVNVSRARPTVESRCVGCRSITFNSRAPREPICVVRTILLLLISKSNLFTVHRGMPSREDREYLGGLSHNSRSIDNCPLTLHTCTITRNATLTCNIHDSSNAQEKNVQLNSQGPDHVLFLQFWSCPRSSQKNFNCIEYVITFFREGWCDTTAWPITYVNL